MRIDVIQHDQLADLTRLLNEACDLEGDRFTAELLEQRLWQYPHNVEALRLGAFEGDRLIGVMTGGVKDEHGFTRVFAVASSHRRKGIGSALLEETERRLGELGASELVACYASPGYFMPGVDPRYTAGICMLERCGFERTDVVVNMVAPIDGRADYVELADRSEEKLRAGGVCIRQAVADQRDAARAWMRQHFPGGWELEVDLTFEFAPIPLWLAWDGDKIVGFAMHGVEMFEGGFGPTGVDEAYRGKGIGGALLLRTMADMQQRGITACEIPWVGPIRFYSNIVGARVNRVFWHMGKRLG